MDHGGQIPMVNEFGLPDGGFGAGVPSSDLLVGGPNGASDSRGSGSGGGSNGTRNGSPEFMSSGSFSEPQNMQNEQLVW